jgi:DNA-binding response OmpR family regulator
MFIVGKRLFTQNRYSRRSGKFRLFADMLVLLVEDHADTREVLGTLLNRCGCQTVTAKDAHEARCRLEELPIEVLISDLNLPDGDGLSLLQEAKQKHSLIKAIALTGRDTPEERDAGLKAGFDFYLTKPIDFHELRQALGR